MGLEPGAGLASKAAGSDGSARKTSAEINQSSVAAHNRTLPAQAFRGRPTTASLHVRKLILAANTRRISVHRQVALLSRNENRNYAGFHGRNGRRNIAWRTASVSWLVERNAKCVMAANLPQRAAGFIPYL